jgi:hypothetical protein
MTENEWLIKAKVDFQFAWGFLKQRQFRWFLVNFYGGLTALIFGPEKSEKMERKFFELLKTPKEKKSAPPK